MPPQKPDAFEQYKLEKKSDASIAWSAEGNILSTEGNVLVGDIIPLRYINGPLNYVPAVTGFYEPTVNAAQYTHIGKQICLYVDVSGLSNSTVGSADLTFSLPAIAHSPSSSAGYRLLGRMTDNGVTQTAPGLIQISPDSVTATCGRTLDNTGGFTATGTKRVEAFLTYFAKASFFDTG